jgi:hypothetical protein
MTMFPARRHPALPVAMRDTHPALAVTHLSFTPACRHLTEGFEAILPQLDVPPRSMAHMQTFRWSCLTMPARPGAFAFIEA